MPRVRMPQACHFHIAFQDIAAERLSEPGFGVYWSVFVFAMLAYLILKLAIPFRQAT